MKERDRLEVFVSHRTRSAATPRAPLHEDTGKTEVEAGAVEKMESYGDVSPQSDDRGFALQVVDIDPTRIQQWLAHAAAPLWDPGAAGQIERPMFPDQRSTPCGW
jgi:hypothetical protein